MKNKSTLAYFRVLIVFAVVFILTEYFYKTGPEPAFISNPSVTLFLVLVLFSLIAFEAIQTATGNLGKSDEQLEAEADAAKEARPEASGLRGLLKSLWGAKPIEQEQDILLDHDYDGIKELDNSLPPWWLYSFYISIVFSVLYLGYYHILGGKTNAESFEEEMEIARLQVEQYKRENPVTFDASTLSAADNLDAGKKIFVTNCAACHMFDGGGGIGPNLTDEYWILGGGAENIYNTISEGGRDGKGMIAWKNSLNAEKMQQVTSYILSLQGTTPEKPKEKEGELWKGE
ncbi:MAG: cbb3-type cytochrome c oxidase N-terminal domain-containing protein [Flavobacteriaceae bacterium]|nr:cbb3-type cytochrome c oxidase N-terminal domain-containing protein [Flavobacteriaceae bacterium]